MQRYLIICAISFVSFLLIGIGFVWLVDPYGLNESSFLENFPRKTAASDKGRNIKSYQVENIKPQTLIIGNSRVELGLPPKHNYYSGTTFNMGLPGASVLMQYDYGWHAIKASGSIKKVILAVDFTDFLSKDNSEQTWDGNWQFRLKHRLSDGQKNIPFNIARAEEQLGFVFSQDALVDSLFTVAQQNKDVNALSENGFNDARLYVSLVRAEGFNALYVQKQQQLKVRLSNPDLKINSDSTAFVALSEFLALAKSQNIEIVMFVNPYQKPYLDLLEELALTDELWSWKQLISEIAKQHQVEFYDFAILSWPVEAAPPLDSHIPTDNLYFWEPSHYKQSFGTLILDAIEQKRCSLEINGNTLSLCSLHMSN